jgi:hypothetical protein
VNKFWLLIVLVLLVGCQKGPTEAVVKGTVTLNGQPVDGGLIRMEPVDGTNQPNDSPIVGGKYELKIAPGEKKVMLYWQQGGGQVEDTVSQGKSPKPVQMFPPKFNTQTELRYTVKNGEQTHDIDVKFP